MFPLSEYSAPLLQVRVQILFYFIFTSEDFVQESFCVLGVKTCVHVHGIFPYICIPYDGSEPHLKLSYRLAASLDKAINIASGFSTSNVQHVYKIVLVSGM